MCRFYIILICALHMGVISSGKESEKHGSSSRFSKLMQRLKRSEGYTFPQKQTSQQKDVSSSSCAPRKGSPQTDRIIRSSASIENGARFIRADNRTKSSTACFNKCCVTSGCDTAIYEQKGYNRCFLFDCHGVCVFKDHSNYAVWEVTDHPTALPEEVELASLHSENKVSDNAADENSQNSVPENNPTNDDGETNANYKDQNKVMSPTPPQKAKPERVAPHTAGLSDRCTSDESCEDPNAGCYSEACHCKEGFYNKDGLCRKECQSSQFGCLGLGTTGRGPECIPKSQHCNSFMECADGSDEFNCDSQELQSNPSPGMPGYSLNKNKGLSEPSSKVTTGKEKESHVDSSKSPSSPELKGLKSKGTLPHNKESTLGKDSMSESVKNKSKAKVVPTKESKLNFTHTTTKKPHSAINHNQKVFVTQEKVIIASSTSEAEGPIIALALGLAFTLILIVLLGCRLRNMKHRLRKGRPLNSNEADYLINGMYL